MRVERWGRIKEIFHGALPLSKGERTSYLDSECGDDKDLRSEVESLLDSEGDEDAFLDKPALETAARLVAEDAAASVVGSDLGNYKVLELIGAGGMGEVYLARDKRLGRKVALKLLPDYFTKDAERLRRFKREARAASALNHPNILTVYEIGEEKGTNFIATEFIDGITLREHIRSGELARDGAIEIALQTASALNAAHQAGIVHRDIKPENIMLRKDGYVKVLDFGLAKLIEELDRGASSASDVSTQALVQTAAGVVMGTALYMSPEQARGTEVDARSDVWSLGCVVYEMLAGRPPFEGETPSHVIVSILDKEPAPLAARARVEVPNQLETIVQRALTKERDKRYQTVEEMSSALRALKQQLDIEAALKASQEPPREASASDASSAATVIVDTADERRSPTAEADARKTILRDGQTISEGKPQSYKRTAVIAALGLVVLVAVGFGIYRFTRPAQGPAASLAFAKTKLSKLTTNGKAGQAAISGDGQFVVHVSGDRGKQTILLKHVATGSDKEIVPVTGDDYLTPGFSHNGSYIYYRRDEKSRTVLYRVPVLGGVAPVKVAEEVDSAITLSPDDKRVAFVRGYPDIGESALMIAGADGAGEEKLLVKKGAVFFPYGAGSLTFGPAWSPDGEMIAFSTRGTSQGVMTNNLKAVRVSDKSEKDLTTQLWTGIGQITWLHNGSGLILNAAEDSSGAFQQIWHVAYPSGEARKVTNDLSNYFGVSLTQDSSTLVTMQGERLSNIWVLPEADTRRAVKISSGKTDGDDGVSWTRDGKIVYTSSTTGDQDLWVMNSDGTGVKQLTRNARRSSGAIVSPDGRFIVFASTRSGERHIWRIDVDGSNPLQLTAGKNEQFPTCTPDSKWVVYMSTDSGPSLLWRVPIDGGAPTQLTDYLSFRPSVSPDGKLTAIVFLDEQSQPKRYLGAIISIEGGKPIKTFELPQTRGRFGWTPDSRAVIYINTQGGVSNLISQPIDGGKPTQLTDFTSDQIFWFDYSPDHHQLAVARGSQPSDVVIINDVK
ncbi:MAG: eukaryotic-like serine/threonine-protein kinase [Acidobacteriota bacterium]|jgi:serine/threonine protein kinase/Tol biopolymer transport system component|nr:eukaryotic-like serine/threonine-protein kinase [Acidobacteriota bacterium]